MDLFLKSCYILPLHRYFTVSNNLLWTEVDVRYNGIVGYLLLAAAAKAAIAPPPSLMDLDVKPTEDFQGKLAPWLFPFMQSLWWFQMILSSCNLRVSKSHSNNAQVISWWSLGSAIDVQAKYRTSMVKSRRTGYWETEGADFFFMPK